MKNRSRISTQAVTKGVYYYKDTVDARTKRRLHRERERKLPPVSSSSNTSWFNGNTYIGPKM